jgi:hypothetical protein
MIILELVIMEDPYNLDYLRLPVTVTVHGLTGGQLGVDYQ